MKILFSILTAALLTAMMPMVISQAAWADGTLFVGADTEEFSGSPDDKIGKYRTSGPNIIGGSNIPIDYFANGLVWIEANNQLVTGTPFINELRTADFNLNQLNTFTADIPNVCCNEDMAFDGVDLWHAHFST